MAIFTTEVETLKNLKTLRGFFLSNRFEHTSFVDVDDDNDNDNDDDGMYSTHDFVCTSKFTFQNHLK